LEKKISGGDYFSLGMCAFGGLGIEGIYAYLLEPFLYKSSMQNWSGLQIIFHWIITCVTWGVLSYILIRKAASKYQFQISDEKKMKKWQWACVILCILFITGMNYIDWNGFKVLIEFQRKGALLFTFQHIYYAFETVLFMLIVVFMQKAFELWFKRTDFPFGGILCGITWGFAHTFTKGSIYVGLEGIIIGFLFGITYLLVNKDIKKTYVVLFLMFIL